MAGVRNPYDERNYLYISQLRLVEKLLPKVSIIENVPGMLNMKILAKDKLAPMSKSISIKLNDDITELCKEIDSTVIEQKNNTGKIIAINKKLSINENEETKMEKEQFLNLIICAFQRRFRQELTNGKIDDECLAISQNLVKKFN